ncbi:hypothetical protein VE01_05817 [Pseudogymnoascus verrucosus]|uniref:Uncharacterized protein n=1 Tax=Pseudogymnoascus verrucosus TaxID=342668 RepID=A0A1B8GK77_9PEZI|nr:uncharacterized protein VE01_05817 [Pseudogymnoascus verrucosus]OBT96235.1 hypothetical protein VE01_05817 [Pseudogymnoascus verrucosus]
MEQAISSRLRRGPDVLAREPIFSLDGPYQYIGRLPNAEEKQGRWWSSIQSLWKMPCFNGGTWMRRRVLAYVIDRSKRFMELSETPHSA